MKIFGLFFLVLLISANCFAQKKPRKKDYLPFMDCDSLVDTYISSLRTQGIDTLIVYRIYCHGCYEGTPTTEYVIWKKEGYYYIQKMDSYHSKYSLHTMSSFMEDPIRFFVKNKEILTTEKFVDPKFYLSDGIDLNTIILYQGKTEFSTKFFDDNLMSVNSSNKTLFLFNLIENMILKSQLDPLNNTKD